MASSVTVPLWVAIAVAVLAVVALIDRLFSPALGWWLRRRANRAIDELNQRLRLKIPPFKLARRSRLIEQLMFDPEVLKAVEDEAKARNEPKSVAHARARRYASEIIPSFSAYAYFRVGASLAKRISTSLYRVRIGAYEEATLYQVPDDASVVFVINHRSNMDYVLVTYLVSENSALSYAVGEWAQVWMLQSLIRAMGGYFVRRDSSNPLYRKVLARYVHMATASGVAQAVFPEGGLTRDGALRPPKLGILSYVVSGFDPHGPARHRVRAGRPQLRPRAGGPRPGGGRGHAAGRAPALRLQPAWCWRASWRAACGCGCAGAGIATAMPASASAGRCRCASTCATVPSICARWPSEQRLAEIERLGQRLMREVGRVVPALPVSLVATAVLAGGERGLSSLELKGAVFDLTQRLQARQAAHVHIPRQDQEYAVEVGLRMLMLRHLVELKDGVYRANPQERALLAYYANAIAHLLAKAASAGGAGSTS